MTISVIGVPPRIISFLSGGARVFPSNKHVHWFCVGDDPFPKQPVRLEGTQGLRHVTTSGVLVEADLRAMTSMAMRIQRLEQRLLPAPETEFSCA